MRSTVRQITIVLLLAVLLAPGLLQARTPVPVRHSAHATRTAQSHQAPGVVSMVWNLLTGEWLKTGGQLDPLGLTSPSTSTTTTSSDTGGQLDPVGGQ